VLALLLKLDVRHDGELREHRHGAQGTGEGAELRVVELWVLEGALGEPFLGRKRSKNHELHDGGPRSGGSHGLGGESAAICSVGSDDDGRGTHT
jgi:hypothetical protein